MHFNKIILTVSVLTVKIMVPLTSALTKRKNY